MKKILYLFLAVTMFACSSGGDDNNSNETFLERYDGVVWDIIDGEVTSGLIMFSNNTQGWIEKSDNNANDEFCNDYAFGVPFDICIDNTNACETNVATIIENLGNRLKIQITEIDGRTFSYTVLYEVSEQANDMNITYTTINSWLQTATRTEMAQISCP
jgi:hypothetical protein